MAAGAEFFYQIRSMTMNAISRPPNLIAMISRLTDVPICRVFVEPREGFDELPEGFDERGPFGASHDERLANCVCGARRQSTPHRRPRVDNWPCRPFNALLVCSRLLVANAADEVHETSLGRRILRRYAH